jgi:hypothetical protein
LRDTLIGNLRFAAAQLKAAGITLLLEAVQYARHSRVLLNRSRQALDIIDAVGSDNLFLQYDIYHMQVMEGDLAATIRAILIGSATCSWRTTPGVTSRAVVRSTILSCSDSSTGWVIRLDRLRIQTCQEYRGRPGMDQALPVMLERE